MRAGSQFEISFEWAWQVAADIIMFMERQAFQVSPHCMCTQEGDSGKMGKQGHGHVEI
jgi:hypothetical protein